MYNSPQLRTTDIKQCINLGELDNFCRKCFPICCSNMHEGEDTTGDQGVKTGCANTTVVIVLEPTAHGHAAWAEMALLSSLYVTRACWPSSVRQSICASWLQTQNRIAAVREGLLRQGKGGSELSKALCIGGFGRIMLLAHNPAER